MNARDSYGERRPRSFMASGVLILQNPRNETRKTSHEFLDKA
jgi:hypothetical protein